jgi:hypothetical protein
MAMVVLVQLLSNLLVQQLELLHLLPSPPLPES